MVSDNGFIRGKISDVDGLAYRVGFDEPQIVKVGKTNYEFLDCSFPAETLPEKDRFVGKKLRFRPEQLRTYLEKIARDSDDAIILLSEAQDMH
jgi:hypothetical protein